MSDKVFQVITAASKGSLEELKKAFESGLSPSSVMDYDRRTPLHLAAAEGHLETVKYLLEEKKVDINVTDRYATKNFNFAITPSATYLTDSSSKIRKHSLARRNQQQILFGRSILA
jgi:glutaminase